jgi:hypothetical protein
MEIMLNMDMKSIRKVAGMAIAFLDRHNFANPFLFRAAINF